MNLARSIIFEQEFSIDVSPDVAITYDLSRYKNNGANTNITYIQLPSGLWVPEFDGTSLIDCGTDVSIYQDRLTLEAWVRHTTLTAGQYYGILFEDDTIRRNFGLAYWGTTNLYRFFIFDGGGEHYVDADTVPIVNEWYHLVATYDGANLNIYRNGLVDSAPTAHVGAIDSDPNELYIGSRNDGVLRMIGNIARARYLSYVLTAGQVLQRYENTKHWFGVHD